MTPDKGSSIQGFKDSSGRAAASSLQPSNPALLESFLPGLPKSAAPPPRRHAGCWNNEQRQFADALVAAWNEAFKTHGTRAYHTRRNHFACVQLHRWIHSPENDGGMTEQDVIEAVRLYAADPHIIKHCQSRFTDFGSWVRGCPENVDKQLARTGRKRGAAAVDPGAAAGRAAAEKLLADMGLDRLIREATQNGVPLARHVVETQAALAKAKRPSPELLHWYTRVEGGLAQFYAQSSDVRTRLEARAEKGFCALRGRPPGRELVDLNTVFALALALFTREPSRGQSEPEQ